MAENSFDIHDDLVQLCKANNANAQRQIYELYSGPMFNVALRILNTAPEAEDVLQEAFLDMFKKINSFRSESSFGAWFKRIVVNKSINQLKKNRHFVNSLDNIPEEAEEEELPQECYSIDNIKTAMDALKPGFRAVFTLYMFESYTHQEIADELGISVGTSKSQLSRAKNRVREELLKRNVS